MAGNEGFEPPRAVKPLTVFKTAPFNRTWVIAPILVLLIFVVDPAGLEPATYRL